MCPLIRSGRQWSVPAPVSAVLALVLIVASMPAGAVQKQTDAKGRRAVAPGDSAIFAQDRAGAYFIARPLKEKYDSLEKRVAALRTDIREAKIDSARAHSQIAGLQAELRDLLLQIGATKLYIPGAKIQTRIESTLIPIADNELLLIDCESIELEGWSGPGIECMLEKTVLDEDGTRFDADFAGIKLITRKTTGNEFFGFYKDIPSRPGERENSPWNGFIFKDFIDNDLTYLTVEGLTAQEGNQNISLVMQNEKGEGSQSSNWRRHAKLKLRVPKCRLVGVRGRSVDSGCTI